MLKSIGPRLLICRVCGAWGLETPGDVAPGLCPKCFEDRLAAAIGVDLGISRPARTAVVCGRCGRVGLLAVGTVALCPDCAAQR